MFRSVTARYRPGLDPALRGVSLDIPAGTIRVYVWWVKLLVMSGAHSDCINVWNMVEQGCTMISVMFILFVS